ncbi:uncharacterized protein METZ01_LOCUS389397, partial [marine metagenome]
MQFIVEMIRMVLKRGHPLGARHLAQAQAFLPSGMAEQRTVGYFFVVIIGIVNHQIASFDQFQNCFIRLVRQVAGIADIAQRLASIFDAVSGGTGGIVERGRPDTDAVTRFERVTGDKIA